MVFHLINNAYNYYWLFKVDLSIGAHVIILSIAT